ncbi:hypothetical protein EJV44_12225 [Ancylobacter aquaticus]|nr:hypothetical protein EJV44_12225 [Ancylobacter aquaticus]
MAKERAGRGAGTLTAQDAAALLLGAIGSLAVKDTPAIVDRYSNLPRFTLEETYDDDLYNDPAFNEFPLRMLPRQHRALDALRTIIEGQIKIPSLFCIGGSFKRFIDNNGPEFDGIDLVIIVSHSNIPSLDIYLYKPKSTAMWIYRRNELIDNHTDYGKLGTTRSCSADVIIEIANLLRGDT